MNHVANATQLKKPRSGGGLLLLRRKAPLKRRSVAYFCSGAHTMCRSRQRRMRDANIRFATAGSASGEENASYDVIFAMAVFRHGKLNVTPPPLTCDHLIHFADFERSVVDLARVLKPGGLLIIQHAMFRFADTRAAAGFKTVFRFESPGEAPYYGRDNRILPITDYPDVIFQKDNSGDSA